MGENLVPARDANPKGFFEDVEVNMINEDILSHLVPPRLVLMGKEFFRSRPLEGQRWLACIPIGAKIPSPPHIADRIHTVTRRKSYCFKDPRFCYTLPAWRPFLRNAVFVCIFRDPASTALSILKESRSASYLHTLTMTFARALKVWQLMYAHVLRVHKSEGKWLFLHYNQFICGNGPQRLQSFVEAPVDGTFPEVSLRRSFSSNPVPREIQQIYEELCELAEYK